jgi:hypothetical protein
VDATCQADAGATGVSTRSTDRRDGSVSEDVVRAGDGAEVPPATGTSASTGDDAVDQALSVVDDLEARPLREHVEVLDAVHRALQDRLADAEG